MYTLMNQSLPFAEASLDSVVQELRSSPVRPEFHPSVPLEWVEVF